VLVVEDPASFVEAAELPAMSVGEADPMVATAVLKRQLTIRRSTQRCCQ